MLCNYFENLSHPEKVQFIGKLTHAAQSSDVLFKKALELINEGESSGLFNNVTILPNHQNINEHDTPATNGVS